jgi:hypothetical protein
MVGGKEFPYTKKGKGEAQKAALARFRQSKITGDKEKFSSQMAAKKKVDSYRSDTRSAATKSKAAETNRLIKAEARFGREMKESDRRMQERKGKK